MNILFFNIIILILLTCEYANSQNESVDKVFYVEIRNGMQINDNFALDDGHLVGGYDSLSYDNKKHYAVAFKEVRPIEFVIGLDTKKKFRSQLHLNYYRQNITLVPPLSLSAEQPYPLTVADMMIVKVSILYNFLYEEYKDRPIQMWVGFSSGVSVSPGYPLNKATQDHFGISKLKQNTEWLLGFDYLITIRITKSGLYLFPAMSLLFPFSGNIGKFEMMQDSTFESIQPIRVFTGNWLVGIGYRFGVK